MALSKKCSRGKKYKRSYKRSNGTRVKGHCYSPRKTSRKTSRKRSYKKSCPTGQVWRKSHKRSSGKRVKGQCVKSRYSQLPSNYFVPLTPSAPPMSQIEGMPSSFIASSLLEPVRRVKPEDRYADMPPLERVY